MAQFPSELRYTKEHEWARKEDDGTIRIGITSHAVEQLGDITLVDLPDIGTDVEAHERFGDIESVKTVSELYAPVSGEVVAVNAELEPNPELVNEGPFEAGWLICVRPANDEEFGELMTAVQYEDLVGNAD